MLQSATLLRKYAPWPNISDEDVSCTAPATRHASLQIPFKRTTPAFVFWKWYKTHTFDSLLTRSRQNVDWTYKSRHVVCSLTSKLNVLRATSPCTFLTSQVPKVFRQWSTMVCFEKFDFKMCMLRTRRFSKPTFKVLQPIRGLWNLILGSLVI